MKLGPKACSIGEQLIFNAWKKRIISVSHSVHSPVSLELR